MPPSSSLNGKPLQDLLVDIRRNFNFPAKQNDLKARRLVWVGGSLRLVRIVIAILAGPSRFILNIWVCLKKEYTVPNKYPLDRKTITDSVLVCFPEVTVLLI